MVQEKFILGLGHFRKGRNEIRYQVGSLGRSQGLMRLQGLMRSQDSYGVGKRRHHEIGEGSEQRVREPEINFAIYLQAGLLHLSIFCSVLG